MLTDASSDPVLLQPTQILQAPEATLEGQAVVISWTNAVSAENWYSSLAYCRLVESLVRWENARGVTGFIVYCSSVGNPPHACSGWLDPEETTYKMPTELLRAAKYQFRVASVAKAGAVVSELSPASEIVAVRDEHLVSTQSKKPVTAR